LKINQLKDFDEIWIVFDTDVLPADRLHNGVAYAASKGVKVASSEPCFEYWLLLHSYSHFTTTALPKCRDVVPLLERAFKWTKYAKNESEAKELIPPIVTMETLRVATTAAQKVRQHHIASNTPFPANPSTEVDKLIRAINDALGRRAEKFLGNSSTP
jgi:hypothetical protein